MRLLSQQSGAVSQPSASVGPLNKPILARILLALLISPLGLLLLPTVVHSDPVPAELIPHTVYPVPGLSNEQKRVADHIASVASKMGYEPSLALKVAATTTQTKLTKADLQAAAVGYAVQYGIDPARFLKTIECESGFNPNIVGDNGTSFGIAQFHYPLRDWGFTREQAMQPLFALAQAAKAFSEGQARRWTCYRLTG